MEADVLAPRQPTSTANSKPPPGKGDFSFVNPPEFGSVEELGLQIVLPPAGKVRIRELLSRSRTVATGAYPSWKMDRLMQWESPEEAKALRLLDVCPAVTRFAEQPFIIRYLDEGIWRDHIPDVVLETWLGQRVVLEIKSSTDPLAGEAVSRAKILIPRLRRVGCLYLVVHQECIDRGNSLSNAKTLLKWRRTAPPLDSSAIFLELLNSQTQLDWELLTGMKICGIPAKGVAAHLALSNLINTNWADANQVGLAFSTQSSTNQKESLQWLLRALGASNRS